jgi:glycosyltransferase involved in cell wall biosynthesis
MVNAINSKISVIIPVYNGENTIRDTIASVLNQTFSALELIIIDDGSTDSTPDVIASISDPRVRAFSYTNSGQAASRNRGVSLAKGEYVSFIDADDLWTPEKLESQWQALQANPEAAVAYSWTDCIDERGQFSRRGSYISASGDVYAKLLLVDFIESGSNPLIRTDAFEAVGGFDESLPAAEDWDLWLRLAQRYRFVAVSASQIRYRQSPTSWSANVLKQEAGSLKVIESAIARTPEPLNYLRRLSLANVYKGLTFKILEGNLDRQQGWIAARLLRETVRYDPKLLKTKVIWKVAFKIITAILLPSQLSRWLLHRTQKILNTTTLLGYMQLEPLSEPSV